jgi:hypothetical protein
MPFLRNILKDLVDKRLWPVALLLVGALVAVPMALGRSAGDTPAPAPAPIADAATGSAAAGGTVSKAAVSLETESSDRRHLDGKVRDPFSAPKVATTRRAAPKAATTAAPAPAPAATSPSPSATTSGSGSGGTGTTAPSTGTAPSSGSTPSKPRTTTPKPKTTPTAPKADDAADTYHVSLRIGVVKADGTADLKTHRDVARLSPLPSVTDPFFVYLGVIETATTHEKRAVFLVSSDATPNGEGACHPTKNDCEAVELGVGETAYFDYTAPSGLVTQYQLELAGIHKTAVKSEAKASAAFARHSVAGAELLDDAATRNVRAAAGARAYRYLPAIGLLVRAKRKHVTAKAAAAGTLIPGLALLPRKDQPGIAVWHSPNK